MAGSPPNVVLLSLDSLRADHLPTYGYTRNTAPTLSDLADRTDVTVFENAFATTAWTLPSHSSMFTGLPTVQHGVYDQGLRIDPEYTLAAKLSMAGYDTAAFLNNGWLTNAGVTDAFNHRFDIFDMEEPSSTIGRNINRLKELFSMQDSGVSKSIQRFDDWVESTMPASAGDRDTPFFAFFHLMEPHYIYNAMRPYHKQYIDQSVIRLLMKQREIYTERGRYFAGETSISDRQMEGLVDLYDSEIKYLDTKLAELFDLLMRRNLFDNSLIIIVGDHGELFGERDLIGHHFSLSEELLHVPMFVKWPEGTNALGANRSSAFVSLTDVFKTVTNMSNSNIPSKYNRSSLEEQHMQDNRRVFAHYQTPDSMLDSFRKQIDNQFDFDDEYDTSISVVRDGSEKLVLTSDDVRYYDLDSDGGETNDQSGTHANRVNELRSALNDHLAADALAVDTGDEFSDGVQEQLESLGYI
ncbi:sulfatase-like hydrolase/transferase [Haloarcula sebkhae]|uniref:Sulfatase-like hydrolase/transferase n=2 Tax=Haloarcula sebkhae TaxID=932660 RepID=A0ACC6VJK4_9EURY|nr:sulfatase-like hydrolase/transferase [Haloarcula sebkhae]GGK75012.1 hypothetical protein GCM10009067_29080 [Haloarcula sebkhae]